MKNILVIGGGGIGSWLIPRISRLFDTNQLPAFSGVVVADDDTIEYKNLKYQNFEEDEILDSKALCLEARYPHVKGRNQRITSKEQLQPFDVIICAVDGGKTRKLVYEYTNETDAYFIDLRAEGTALYVVTSDTKKSLKELKASVRDAEDMSCQLEYELEQGIIQLGNTIIAEIGAQCLLNYSRDIPNIEFNFRF